MNLPKKQIKQELMAGKTILEIVTAYGYSNEDAKKIAAYEKEVKNLRGHAAQKIEHATATMTNPAVAKYVDKNNARWLDLHRGGHTREEGGVMTHFAEQYTLGRPNDLASFFHSEDGKDSDGDCVDIVKDLVGIIRHQREIRFMSGINAGDIDPFSAKMGGDCIQAGFFELFRRASHGVFFYTACGKPDGRNTELLESTKAMFGAYTPTAGIHHDFVVNEAAKAGCLAEPILISRMAHPDDKPQTEHIFRMSFLITTSKNKWK